VNKKILIIGKKSFIGSNLFKFLIKKKVKVSLSSYINFLNNYKSFDNKFNFIINCSSNIKFIKNKYDTKNDNDLIIAKKILNSKTKLVTLSSRKVYKPKFNIKEGDKKKPNCNYSKNKLASEILVKKILKDKSLILRISNIIGLPNKNKRKLHKTFVDIFFDMVKRGYLYDNKKIYKDFISIEKLSEIIFKLIKKNSFGVYNVSVGKKVYLSLIITWLNYYNYNKIIFIKPKKSFNNDNFTLNNMKLMNKIQISNNLSDLKNDCLSISKKIFIEK
tara:strand:+ start:155 stop:979 length:825 start_codon:yes stop_codon:yes gene_type:complete